jgi:uncharacterized protein YdbL (DUF1318 family)
MKKYALSAFLVVGFFLSGLASALDLDEARSKRLVTELPTGFIKANDDQAKKLVEEINKKRKQAYEDIAKKNGIPVEAVGAQAAKKIEENLKNQRKAD